MNKATKTLVFSFFVVVVLIGWCSVVEAENVSITFSDLNLQKGTKILVYNATGHLLGEYNTTDTVILNSTQDYIFVLKPSEQVWFQNPLNALELFKVSVPAFLSYLLFAVVIVGTGYLVTRVLR